MVKAPSPSVHMSHHMIKHPIRVPFDHHHPTPPLSLVCHFMGSPIMFPFLPLQGKKMPSPKGKCVRPRVFPLYPNSRRFTLIPRETLQ